MKRAWTSVFGLVFSSFFAITAAAQQKVTFASTDGDLKGGEATTLTGYMHRPDGAGPFAAVVLMHGCDGLVEDGKVKDLYGAWGPILSREGYIVLMPDSFGSRGHGNLCGVQPPSARPVQANREAPRDAYGALT